MCIRCGWAGRTFQSTLPARGATDNGTEEVLECVFQSTLPARGATTCGTGSRCNAQISIHAPRTGSDAHVHDRRGHPLHFNPRSPHGERRTPSAAGFSGWGYFNPRSPHGERRRTSRRCSSSSAFQSTLPARGATRNAGGNRCRRNHFNPRSPHGERHFDAGTNIWTAIFQSTLPARGATAGPAGINRAKKEFQSTLPARGATR